LLALSFTFTVAVRVPVAVGVNVTLILRVDFAAGVPASAIAPANLEL
jgi:hypothetical protein